MLENIFQMSAGLISAAMIGRLGPILISSQGVSSRITRILWSLFKGIGVCVTVVNAQSRGEDDFEKCKKTFEQTVITGCLIAFFLIFLFFFFSSNILSFFTDNNEVLINAEKYTSIVIFTAPFLMIMSAVTGAFQANTSNISGMRSIIGNISFIQ